MTKLTQCFKTGTCKSGAESDRGYIVHYVENYGFPSWNKAICGTVPRSKGNGWNDSKAYSVYRGVESTMSVCPNCLKKAQNIEYSFTNPNDKELSYSYGDIVKLRSSPFSQGKVFKSNGDSLEVVFECDEDDWFNYAKQSILRKRVTKENY